MQKAIVLAREGEGFVSPNPMVGCVIVCDEKIVSEGYHEKYGGPHAEVNAISKMPADIDPVNCTLYVNLEPCSHHGKTPPCSDLIISKGFKKVVIANTDPNPLVAGKGIERLKKAGIDVISGICKKEGRMLNRKFFTFYEKNRPYITLKWAQTKDGFISRLPVPENREDNYISNDESNKQTHYLRATHDAILVGKNTVLADNPSLTVRLVKGRNPIRVVIGNLEYDEKLAVFSGEASTLIFGTQPAHKIGIHEWIKIDPDSMDFIDSVVSELAKRGISSLLVEGGKETLTAFIARKLYDEVYVIVNQEKCFGTGLNAPDFRLNTDFQYVVNDRWYNKLVFAV